MGHKPEQSKARIEAQAMLNAQREYKDRKKKAVPVPFGNAVRAGKRIFTAAKRRGK
jgi:hypothetical protein